MVQPLHDLFSGSDRFMRAVTVGSRVGEVWRIKQEPWGADHDLWGFERENLKERISLPLVSQARGRKSYLCESNKY